MSKVIDLTGLSYNRLTVIRRAKLNYTMQACWFCRCICGKELVCTGYAIRTGTTKSCGCFKARKLDPKERKRRKSLAAKIKQKDPVRKQQKRQAQLKYTITDKAALSQFRRWCKKQSKIIYLTDEHVLMLRNLKCHKCQSAIPRTGVCFILINPKGPISIENVLPTCGICKLIKPKEDFNSIEFTKKVIRRYWKKTPMAAIAKQKARKAIGKYECAICKNLFSDKQLQLDHIVPVVGTDGAEQSLETWISRLLCDENNLQYLCKGCHSVKTQAENKVRRENKKRAKENK